MCEAHKAQEEELNDDTERMILASRRRIENFQEVILRTTMNATKLQGMIRKQCTHPKRAVFESAPDAHWIRTRICALCLLEEHSAEGNFLTLKEYRTQISEETISRLRKSDFSLVRALTSKTFRPTTK